MTLIGCWRFTGTPTQNEVVSYSLLGEFTKASESRISETKFMQICPWVLGHNRTVIWLTCFGPWEQSQLANYIWSDVLIPIAFPSWYGSRCPRENVTRTQSFLVIVASLVMYTNGWLLSSIRFSSFRYEWLACAISCQVKTYHSPVYAIKHTRVRCQGWVIVLA